MRKLGFRAVFVLAIMGLTFGAFASSAGAGIPDEALPSLSVTKVVVAGPLSYTVTGAFTIQVQCEDYSATLKYNADGSIQQAPGGWVGAGSTWTFQDWDIKRSTCTITEQAGGAATFLSPGSPTYACTFTNEPFVTEATGLSEEYDEPGCLSTDGTDPAVVHFGSPWDRSCQIVENVAQGEECLCVQSAAVTVTNTIADDPIKVAAANAGANAPVITPKFTG